MNSYVIANSTQECRNRAVRPLEVFCCLNNEEAAAFCIVCCGELCWHTTSCTDRLVCPPLDYFSCAFQLYILSSGGSTVLWKRK